MPKGYPGTMVHGKYTTYNNHKCRCDACSEAWREYQRKRRAKNKDKYREYQRTYRERHKERLKKKDRRVKYGITEEEYQTMLSAQDDRCAICRDEMDPPHVDHCHETGDVRGLLCVRCNNGLGFFRDNAEALVKAALYVSETKEALTAADLALVAEAFGVQ